jgi:DNA-binding winged helix-turn-helix (wHTH) protein/GGDEF domain-containing protein
MGYMQEFGASFVLDNRWLLDVTQDRLVDLQVPKRSVRLKPVDTRILSIFVRSPRTVLSRRQLLNDGWRAYGFEVCESSLNQVICNLRSTFETLQTSRSYIKTVPRVGYCLVVDARPAENADLRNLSVVEVGEVRERVVVESDDFRGITGQPVFDQILRDEWSHANLSGLPLSLLVISIGRQRVEPVGCGCADKQDLLEKVSQCIAKSLRRSSDRWVCHGDTFSVLLPFTGKEGARTVANNIQVAVNMALDHCGLKVAECISLRIGVATTVPVRFASVNEFADAADNALREELLL